MNCSVNSVFSVAEQFKPPRARRAQRRNNRLGFTGDLMVKLQLAQDESLVTSDTPLSKPATRNGTRQSFAGKAEAHFGRKSGDVRYPNRKLRGGRAVDCRSFPSSFPTIQTVFEKMAIGGR